MIHGIANQPAIVTRSVARCRARLGPYRAIAYLKRITHRRHRRLWRAWCANPERREPSARSLTSREIW